MNGVAVKKNQGRTDLVVSGMTCANCVRHVREALVAVPGVNSAEVDLENKTARVRWSPEAKVEPEKLVNALAEEGYQSKVKPGTMSSTQLRIPGITCNNCARHVEEAVRRVPGVEGVDVSVDGKTATIRWAGGTESQVKELLEILREEGYPAKIVDAQAPQSRWAFLSGWKFNVVFGLAVTIPMILAEFVFKLGMEPWYRWTAFAAALPVQVLCGARFYIGAWNQLKVGQSNMDTLVALGSTTAFVFSTWGLLAGWHGHLYFMDSAAIISLVSLGHYLEAKMSARAASSLKGLLQLAPERASKWENGKEREVAVAELNEGDLVVLRPGNRIPTDGEVAEGQSTVDESMLTGESMPLEKGVGAKLYAGTLNVGGRMLMRVSSTGEETALAHIIQVVREAQSSRASIQRLGDKISSVFVPIVVVIALATALWWGFFPEQATHVARWLGQFLWKPHLSPEALSAAVIHAAAVLIIACPCAMGLATPVAIMAGTNVAATRGILITDGAAMEKSGRITSILFDKTGTLTQGKVAVAEITELQKTAVDLSELAAALARGSTHPLSQAIAGLSSGPLTFESWEEIRGSGLRGVLESKSYRLGSLRWLQPEQVDLTKGAPFIDSWSGQGATVVGIAEENKLLGLIALRDQPKQNAAAVVAELKSQRKKVYLVTGDSRATAEAIAAQVGIDREHVFAEVRPEGKVEVIQRLQQKGQRVAFVGDGINDAPALESADLGIAVMKASDVAREAADIILLKSDLEAIPQALALAQKTLRTIKQNLFWAFFYNAAGVPLAALGFFTPMMSALAMGLSDLIVVGNALRLRWWRS